MLLASSSLRDHFVSAAARSFTACSTVEKPASWLKLAQPASASNASPAVTGFIYVLHVPYPAGQAGALKWVGPGPDPDPDPGDARRVRPRHRLLRWPCASRLLPDR